MLRKEIVVVMLIGFMLVGLVQVVKAREKEELFELEEIVVTGTKRERKLKDVPVRTEIITSKEIENKGAANLYDALEGEPGIRVEQQCSYCNFSILRIQGMESGHSQILIDGQPIYTGLAGVYGLQQIQAGNIERIEIVKGAGSALYGSDAIAGVVNVIMKEPEPKPMMNINTMIGFHRTGKLTNKFSTIASKREGNLATVITAQKDIGDDIDEDGDGITDRVETDNFGAGIKLYLYDTLGTNSRFSIFGRTLNEYRHGGEYETWQNSFAEGCETIKTTRYEAGLGYRKKFQYDNQFDFNFNYSMHNRDATNDAILEDIFGVEPDTKVVTGPGELPEPLLAEEHIIVTEANYSHPIGDHIILGGVQYRRSDFWQEIGQHEGRRKTTKEADDIGVYMQGEIKASDNLDLVLGARYDYHDSKEHYDIGDVPYKESSLNPRLAVKYSPMEDLTFRASVGTGFRVPYHFDEDLHLCSGSPRIAKPIGLKLESSLSLQLGGEFRVREVYYIGLNFLRTNVKDKIAFEPTAISNYDYEWANIGDAYTQGVEVSADGPLIGNLGFEIGYVYTDAEYKENPYAEYDTDIWGGKDEWEDYHERGKYIPRSPFHTGNLSLTYKQSPWNLILSARYTGNLYIEYFKDDEALMEIKKTDPFWVCDMRISRVFSKELNCFLGVKNLFDYVQEDRRPDNAAFMWAPYTGRMIYGGIGVKF